MLRDSTPRYVGPSVGRLVPFLLFQRFWALWAYGSCPDDLETFSSTAPAHPHATRVAVYPALFFSEIVLQALHISHYPSREESHQEIVWESQRKRIADGCSKGVTFSEEAQFCREIYRYAWSIV